jgi:hypothetical protein
MKKFFLALMVFVSSIASAQTLNTLDPTQVYTTGNLVQPTVSGTNTTPWVNGVYQNELTCWTSGDPGYCGPNAIVRPGNNINFSYGTTNLYQMQLISSLLPNSGTGLRVNGYNFSFMAKNGNGWDDGRVDYLSAYVSFYDSKGSTVFNQNYDLQYKFDWTSFNFSENFTTPFATKNLGSVQYGFVGRDLNFWAGPYGPEVTNVSFNLKYSVDPCFNNPLYSPTCPGFADALAKLTPPLSTNTIETVTNTSITSLTLQPPITTATQTPVFEKVSTASSTPSVLLTSTGNNKETSVNSNGVSIGLNVIARNQQKEQSIAMQASQNAIMATEQTAQQAQQESINVAQVSSASNIVSSNVSPVKNESFAQKNEQNVSLISLVSNVSPTLQTIGQQNLIRTNETNRSNLETNFSQEISQNQTSTIKSVNRGESSFTQTQVTLTQINPQEQAISTQSQITYSLLPPQQSQQIATQVFVPILNETTQASQTILSSNQQSITPSFEMSLSESQRLLTDRTNPVNEIIEGRGVDLQTTTNVQQKTSVNTNVSDNEIAGGVNISRMATTPVGYNQYLNLVIADAAFYAPKEIYKGQRNVDNVRALRQMSSDRLHQEMVNQQYKRN